MAINFALASGNSFPVCTYIRDRDYFGLRPATQRKSFQIDHFHYDVTRTKVSGSCSKDRAQCRAIAGKCQKSAEAPCRPIKGKLPGVLQSYVLDCYTNSKKFSVELFMYFFFR